VTAGIIGRGGYLVFLDGNDGFSDSWEVDAVQLTGPVRDTDDVRVGWVFGYVRLPRERWSRTRGRVDAG